jgi:hypothetical protein
VAGTVQLKLFIVGDPCRGIGNPNDDVGYMVDWLCAALGPAVRQASGAISTLRGDTSGGALPTRAFMAAAGLEPTPAGWAQLQTLDPLPTAACEIIDALIDPDATIIVGWGIPPWLLRRLLRHKTPIINLELDPIRFCRDVRMSADIYGLKIADFFAPLALDEEATSVDAALFAAHHAMYPRLPWLRATCRTAVFAGQTPVDLALVSGGRLVAPGDLVDDLKSAASGHDLLLVTPHPLAIDWRLLDDLARRIANAFPMAWPTYDVMLSPAVDTVFAATSSVVDEATALGLQSRHLRPPDVRTFGARHRTRRLLLDQGFFHPAVWQARAQGKKKPPVLAPMSGAMPLRQSLGLTPPGAGCQPPMISKLHPLMMSSTAPQGLLPGLGWAAVEPWGRWTLGSVSTLVLIVDARDCPSPALEIVLAASWLSERPDLEVAVTRMGRDPNCLRWRPTADSEVHTMVLPLGPDWIPDAKPCAVFLRIDCSHVHKVPGYDDGRGLGIGVQQISLVETKHD